MPPECSWSTNSIPSAALNACIVPESSMLLSEQPARISSFVYDERTGAPFEHAGFGRFASDAKNRQREFLIDLLSRSADGRLESEAATRTP